MCSVWVCELIALFILDDFAKQSVNHGRHHPAEYFEFQISLVIAHRSISLDAATTFCVSKIPANEIEVAIGIARVYVNEYECHRNEYTPHGLSIKPHTTKPFFHENDEIWSKSSTHQPHQSMDGSKNRFLTVEICAANAIHE